MSYAALATAEIIDSSAEHKRWKPAPHADTPVPIHILLAEDDESDITLTKYALDGAEIDYELHTLSSGAEVIPYLRGQGRYRDEPKPQLLMLDLSMPGKDGFEILADLSDKPECFGDLPIVILTGDKHSSFLKKSYGLNISAYLTKPCTAEKIQSAFAAIRNTKT